MCIYLGHVDPRSILHFQELLPTMSTTTPSNPSDDIPLPAAPQRTTGLQSSDSELSDPPLSDDVPLPVAPQWTTGLQSSDSELSDPPPNLSDDVPLPVAPQRTTGLQSSDSELSDLPESSVDEGNKEDLGDDSENDPFYQSYHNPPDPVSNDSEAGASATAVTISDAQEIADDSDPCGNCSARSSLVCDCDMRYCSQECLEAHRPQHENICRTFLAQEPRPSIFHHRGILLLHDSHDLRFEWTLEPEIPGFGLSELAPLIEITPDEDRTREREGGKDGYLSITCWQEDQTNQSLADLLGRESGTLRGTVLLRAFVEEEIEPSELGNDSTIRSTTRPVQVDVGTADVVGFFRYCHLLV